MPFDAGTISRLSFFFGPRLDLGGVRLFVVFQTSSQVFVDSTLSFGLKYFFLPPAVFVFFSRPNSSPSIFCFW